MHLLHRFEYGFMKILLGLEDLDAVDTDLGVLLQLFNSGIRCVALTYNDGNALGGGLASGPDDGLTRLSHQAVALVNDLAITADVAHVGDRTALNVCRVSRPPVVVSHVGTRAVWPTPRMKPDPVVDATAGTGVVVAVSAAPNSAVCAVHPRHNLNAAMDHLICLSDRLGPVTSPSAPIRSSALMSASTTRSATGPHGPRRRTSRSTTSPGCKIQAKPPGMSPHGC
jgi:microsomal dipeptidase-like Zn-dependent dipeptidase